MSCSTIGILYRYVHVDDTGRSEPEMVERVGRGRASCVRSPKMGKSYATTWRMREKNQAPTRINLLLLEVLNENILV
jgi:hypothetical protein